MTDKQRLIRYGIGFLLFFTVLWTLPYQWCNRESEGWYRGDSGLQDELALGLLNWLETDPGKNDFKTGSERFNGEWLFGTYLMTGLGFGQTILQRPDTRDRYLPAMETCIERLLTPEVRAFDTVAWKADALDSLDEHDGHAAYLGYLNILLGLHRQLVPDSKFASLNDDITATLSRRLNRQTSLLVETYPNEFYPVDNTAVIGSIALYDRVTGESHRMLLDRWEKKCRAAYIDERTGLLIQSVSATGKPIDKARGSGSALAAYFLSFLDSGLSKELYAAIRKELAGNVLGFGAVREYPASVDAGTGDIDSGPILFGWGFSATGFSLAGSRIHGDAGFFKRLCATTYMAGAPCVKEGARTYITGGPLGAGILFAMFTAPPQAPGGTP